MTDVLRVDFKGAQTEAREEAKRLNPACGQSLVSWSTLGITMVNSILLGVWLPGFRSQFCYLLF